MPHQRYEQCMKCFRVTKIVNQWHARNSQRSQNGQGSRPPHVRYQTPSVREYYGWPPLPSRITQVPFGRECACRSLYAEPIVNGFERLSVSERSPATQTQNRTRRSNNNQNRRDVYRSPSDNEQVVPARDETRRPTRRQPPVVYVRCNDRSDPTSEAEPILTPARSYFVNSHTYAYKYQPVQRSSLAGETNPDEACSICIDAFEPNCNVRRLQCMHLFHAGCVDLWLVKKNSCPVCRCELNNRRTSLRSIPSNAL